MGERSVYVCDYCGRSCNDTDILNDASGGTRRVIFDAQIAVLAAGTPPVVSSTGMGRHVFCQVDHAVAWSQALGL